MKTVFKDYNGVDWNALVTVGAIDRVLEGTNGEVNIYEIGAEGSTLFQRLMTEPQLLVRTLFIILEDQAKEKNISAQDFAKSLGGETLGDAIDALVEGIIGFFPKEAVRKKLRLVTTSMEELQDKIHDRADQMFGIAMEKVQKRTLEQFDESCTSLLESLESNPSDEPSESSSGCQTVGNVSNGQELQKSSA